MLFTILPTGMWKQFRNIPNFTHIDIDVAHKLTKKNANLMFVEIRKLHYNIMRRSMDMNEADVLAGHAKLVSARRYVIYMNWINSLNLIYRLGANSD